MNRRKVITVTEFATVIHKLLRSDRDVNLGIGGMTGEGKSTFATSLQKEYARVSNTSWDFSRMTWDREELLTWIDGKPDTKEDRSTGLREGQLPEYSAILPDELLPLFYKRNWFDDDQIDAVSTFNMCRDRHLFVAGNIPSFWDLDSSFIKRIRFYAYVPERGRVWIFEQENNPFAEDPWNRSENKKIFRKKRNPYYCPNFLFEIHYDDWTPSEKDEYLKIRNTKRLQATKRGGKNNEKYKDIKEQRNKLILLIYDINPKMTDKKLAELSGIGKSLIGMIRNGER